MHQRLPNNTMRDKNFNGIVDENDCEDEDIRKFLELLQDKEISRRTKHIPLTE